MLSWNDVLKIIMCVFASAGGIGGVVLLVVKASAKMVGEYITKKYENKLKKDLECYKADLSEKSYVTKSQYDFEFEIYRSLTKSFFEMIVKLMTLFSPSYFREISTAEDICSLRDGTIKASEKIADAQDVLHTNSPFIQKDIYEKYEIILTTALDLFWEYLNCLDEEKRDKTICDEEWRKERYNTVCELDENLAVINDELRIYLKNLAVLK